MLKLLLSSLLAISAFSLECPVQNSYVCGADGASCDVNSTDFTKCATGVNMKLQASGCTCGTGVWSVGEVCTKNEAPNVGFTCGKDHECDTAAFIAAALGVGSPLANPECKAKTVGTTSSFAAGTSTTTCGTSTSFAMPPASDRCASPLYCKEKQCTTRPSGYCDGSFESSFPCAAGTFCNTSSTAMVCVPLIAEGGTGCKSNSHCVDAATHACYDNKCYARAALEDGTNFEGYMYRADDVAALCKSLSIDVTPIASYYNPNTEYYGKYNLTCAPIKAPASLNLWKPCSNSTTDCLPPYTTCQCHAIGSSYCQVGNNMKFSALASYGGSVYPDYKTNEDDLRMSVAMMNLPNQRSCAMQVVIPASGGLVSISAAKLTDCFSSASGCAITTAEIFTKDDTGATTAINADGSAGAAVPSSGPVFNAAPLAAAPAIVLFALVSGVSTALML